MAGYPYYQNPYQVGYANFQPYQGYQTPPVQQQPEFRYYPVNGEEGANNFLVAAGQSVMLMDTANNTFYIKSTDSSGMPLPLRIFDFTERVSAGSAVDMTDYVTHDELKKWAEELKASLTKEGGTSGRKSAS